MNSLIQIENIFIKEKTKEVYFRIAGPLLLGALICSIIWTRKCYLSITNDDKYLYYKKFSRYFRIGSFLSSISLFLILTKNLRQCGEILFWITVLSFIIGNVSLYVSGMYIIDEKKFSNLSPNALYILKPSLESSSNWVKFAAILGSLLLLYKIGEWIFLKIW